MTTVKAVILKHQLKADQTYNVKIRITHNRASAYIKTNHIVNKKNVSKDLLTIKDNFIATMVDRDVFEIRRHISELGYKSYPLTAKELTKHLLQKLQHGDQTLNFFTVAQELVDELKVQKRISTASTYSSAANNLHLWLRRPNLTFAEMNVNFLNQYELHLTNKYGAGMRGVESNLASIRAIFNFARSKYNNDELGDIKISNNPFARFKLPKTKAPKHRALEVDQVKRIRDYAVSENPVNVKWMSRAELARDVYMLSFYLCGMNGKDLFIIENKLTDRITYCRAKTATRRSDSAEISIALEPEVLALIKKYKDPSKKRVFCFYKHYADERTFNSAINKGLKEIGASIGVEKLEFYSARHSWATIARNDCDVSKDDISMSLNHSDPTKTVTDKYIKKDWSRIDRANRKVLDFIK